MKESKKFFDNNRLNKGSTRLSKQRQSDINLIRDKYQHVLPPVDMLEHYEEMNPGTLNKLLEMTEQEQKHRHAMDLIAIDQHDKALRIGRIFALVFVGLVAIISLLLVIAGSVIAASIFAFSAFSCIAVVSYFYSNNSGSKEYIRNKERRNNSSRYNKNQRKTKQ